MFQADGVLAGTVALPDGLKRGTIPEFDPTLEIGLDYILGVWVNEFGIDVVREYRLERPTIKH